MPKIIQTKLILYVSIFLCLFDNYTFFQNTINVYPLGFSNITFLISLAIIMIAVTTILFTLVSSRYTTKPLLISVLLISALVNYFMNSYHIVVDDSMIRNMLQTNINESLDLLTWKQVLYFVFLGIIPSLIVYDIQIKYRTFKKEIISKLKVIVISIIIILVTIFLFSQYYTSFFREHKPLRYSINPTYWIYSIGKYINTTYMQEKLILQPIGTDAKITSTTQQKKLVILVVGEAARADHFSLNGYNKLTNPLLQNQDIINFTNFYSCGTSTAKSVPCMFSSFDKAHFDYKKGISYENILDVLNHTKQISILWRDNNSSSKGVALRVPYQDYKTSKNNPICIDGECRDEGMLVGLDKYIQQHKNKNILIVLHQMGNHGPAYYKRYTKKFQKFTPVCKTSQLEQCKKQTISNSYDNAILYTDYFLDKTINFLKQYDNTYETAMIYMSDHGESLGENGIYLHGLPYFMAPDAQIHIGSFIWFGNLMNQNLDISLIKQNSEKKLSHDNLFHTLLGLFQVKTKIYDKNLDILNHKF